MKLGLMLAFSSGSELNIPVRAVQLAERLGYDSVWTAETWGTDAITPLAYLAGKTERIRLGTSVIQVAARTPASTAMSMATVDAMAGGGRAIIGIGLSGPQVVEGWYGRPWGRPYWQLRDYAEIIRKILRREGPVVHEGREISLPYSGEGAMGIGKPLKSILHMNPDIPIWLGTGTDTNVRLTAEIADGWIPMNFVPGTLESYRAVIEEGFRRAGGGKSWKDFEIQGSVSVTITEDLKGAFAASKPFVALYVGGMGHPKMNFHKKRMTREGWGEAAERIQELFLAGKREEAIEAVPDEYVDEGGLYGTPVRIAQRWRAQFEGLPFTGMTLQTNQDEAIELMAELLGTRDTVGSSD